MHRRRPELQDTSDPSEPLSRCGDFALHAVLDTLRAKNALVALQNALQKAESTISFEYLNVPQEHVTFLVFPG